MKYFIDANVILRFLLNDHKEHSPKAKLVFREIEEEKAIGLVNPLVIHEVLYISIKVYKQDKKDVISRLKSLMELKNLQVLDISEESLSWILTEFAKRNIDFPDLAYAKYCEQENISIISFDRHFDKLDISRVENI